MKGMRIVGLTFLAMFVFIPALLASDMRFEADLMGPAIMNVKPDGDANFRATGERRKLSVEVEDVNYPDGTMLMVKIGGTYGRFVGDIMLEDQEGELELDTARGDMIPVVYEGTPVEVFFRDKLILSGVFMMED
jgi:hypothetical protein